MEQFVVAIKIPVLIFPRKSDAQFVRRDDTIVLSHKMRSKIVQRIYKFTQGTLVIVEFTVDLVSSDVLGFEQVGATSGVVLAVVLRSGIGRDAADVAQVVLAKPAQAVAEGTVKYFRIENVLLAVGATYGFWNVGHLLVDGFCFLFLNTHITIGYHRNNFRRNHHS
jgi:hypothetical protein